ncbi:MAG: molybdate ABC transporter substrate-binding protein [Dissulfurispiraceae bacterium]|jgi:molybdate transport system substrate-binding protein
MLKKILLLFIAMAALSAPALTFAEPPKEIIVSAAISLKNAFEEIGILYETKNAGAKVIFNFGASGDLMRQIEGGAPVDVFASAAQKDMDDAEKKGLIASESRVNFAGNSVVLIVPLNSGTDTKSFADLASETIKKIAVGNPMTVPAGRYAEEVLTYYNMVAAVKDKLIFTENVRQVLDYVARGEVDAGVVYATDAAARPKETKIVATAPEASHKPVIYPVAVVKATKIESSAKAFIALLLSPEGRKILQKYGFKAAK